MVSAACPARSLMKTHHSRPPVIAIVCVASLLLLLLPSAASAEIRGHLLLRLDCYHHPSDVRSDGRRCDRSDPCDPLFKFCLSALPHEGNECSLTERSLQFNNQRRLGVCAADQDQAEPFPALLNVSFTSTTTPVFLSLFIDEIDKSGLSVRSKEIDHLRYTLDRLPTVGNAQQPAPDDFVRLKATKRVFVGPNAPTVNLSALLQCRPRRFGPRCAGACVPTDKYSCNSTGSRICKPGWLGDRCTQQDHCASSPCKAWAECRQSGDGFECWCGGRAGPQCVKGADPCLNHLCANNATCVGTGTDSRPLCRCRSGWTGPLCDKQDPCAFRPCGNRGKCVTKSGAIDFVCECHGGWSGRFCATPRPTTAPSTTSVITNAKRKAAPEEMPLPMLLLLVGLGGLVALGLVTALIICAVRRRQSWTHKSSRNDDGNCYTTPMIMAGRAQRTPWNEENTYEDPDHVYSSGSECEYVDQTPAPGPPPPLSRQSSECGRGADRVSGGSGGKMVVFVRGSR